MVDFRKELMLQNSVKSLKEVVRNLIPLKGFKWKANVERRELLDFEVEKISLEEFQQECDEDEVTENDLAAVEDNSEVVDATTVQCNPRTVPPPPPPPWIFHPPPSFAYYILHKFSTPSPRLFGTLESQTTIE